MNAPSTHKTQTFNLLSIGHRGVGKTVFLVGSYAEQQPGHGVGKSSTWFECQDNQVQNNLNSLLEYIAQTGQYPPATMKITNFNFTARSKNLFGEKELCKFRWWDIPGEICNNDNPNFQKMVMESHGCCVFIDAYTLFNDTSYSQSLQNVVKQVETIASLARQGGLTYIFAIVLTKCDLLAESPHKLLKIEENIRPLMARLDANKIHYRKFYSTNPIVKNGKMATLQAKGTSAPFLWLASELSQTYRKSNPQSLSGGIDRILTNSAQPATSRLSRPQGMVLGNKAIAGLAVAGVVGIFAILIALLLGRGAITPESDPPIAKRIESYENVLKEDPHDPEALLLLSRLYSDLTQFDKALPLMEKLVEQQPDKLDFLFELAVLYALNGDKIKEESIYDKILELDPKSILALTSKASLRAEQGKSEEAKALFNRAEQAAPTDQLKQEIRQIASDAEAKSDP